MQNWRLFQPDLNPETHRDNDVNPENNGRHIKMEIKVIDPEGRCSLRTMLRLTADREAHVILHTTIGRMTPKHLAHVANTQMVTDLVFSFLEHPTPICLHGEKKAVQLGLTETETDASKRGTLHSPAGCNTSLSCGTAHTPP